MCVIVHNAIRYNFSVGSTAILNNGNFVLPSDRRLKNVGKPFVAGLEETLFPHRNSLGSSEELEEERRLCYVAITRAKEKLYLTNAKKRMLYGNDMINIPSRFLNEIDKELLDIENKEVVLLCYEKGEDFCHRHILSKYLESKHNIKIDEL